MSERWVEAADLDSVPEGEVIGIRIEGRSIALYNVDGAIYATAGICTHQEFRLCDGFLDGHEIECALHQGRFDIRTGEALCAPVTEALVTFPTRVEGHKILIALADQ